MAEFSLPFHIIPADATPEQAESWRQMMRWMAQEIKTRNDEILHSRPMKNPRTASGLRSMQNVVSLDKAVKPETGWVLVAIDDGVYATWAPIDGIGPNGGEPGGVGAHNILDGAVHLDSVADGVTKGSLIVGNATPKWDELVVGTDGYVLTADSAQTLGVKWAVAASTPRTRRIFIEAARWFTLTGAAALAGVRVANTAVDHTVVSLFTSAGDSSIGGTAFIPADYNTGTLEFFLHWAAITGAGDTNGFYIDFDARGMVPSTNAIEATVTAVAADQVLTTTSPIDTNYYRTSLGTLSTDVAAGRAVKMQFKRDVTAEIAAGGLATVQSLGFVGIEIAYTADY